MFLDNRLGITWYDVLIVVLDERLRQRGVIRGKRVKLKIFFALLVSSVCSSCQPLDGKIHARKRALMVKSWSTVKDLKDILQSLLHLPAASQV